MSSGEGLQITSGRSVDTTHKLVKADGHTLSPVRLIYDLCFSLRMAMEMSKLLHGQDIYMNFQWLLSSKGKN